MRHPSKMSPSKESLHDFAQSLAPSPDGIRPTWPSIIAALLTHLGPGAIFIIMLVGVYLDLQAANHAMVDVVKSNTEVIERMLGSMESTQRAIERIESRK